jgi:hypothetical protein
MSRKILGNYILKSIGNKPTVTTFEPPTMWRALQTHPRCERPSLVKILPQLSVTQIAFFLPLIVTRSVLPEIVSLRKETVIIRTTNPPI